MTEFDSLEDIKIALALSDIQSVLERSARFLRKARSENRQDVKDFLKEIVGHADPDGSTLHWLCGYEDPDLVPFLVSQAQTESRRRNALYALLSLPTEAIVAHLKTVRSMALAFLSEDKDSDLVLQLIRKLGDVEELDVVVNFLGHRDHHVRESAMLAAIVLSKLAGRADILDRVKVLLNDRSPHVAMTTAFNLHLEYPELFPDDPLNGT